MGVGRFIELESELTSCTTPSRSDNGPNCRPPKRDDEVDDGAKDDDLSEPDMTDDACGGNCPLHDMGKVALRHPCSASSHAMGVDTTP